ncbi:MAG: flavodoxin domain-containing protein [Microbacterium sp.]
MKALVVYESMFGNTRRIAEAIAAGLAEHAQVETVDVAHAPVGVPPDIDLLVLGGPTHAFSMSRDTTRQDAVRRGASTDDARTGIRDWIGGLPSTGSLRFAAFDTRVDIPLLPGSAAKAATRVAERHGFRVAEPESFRVKGYEGPLIDGEIARAAAWGRDLAAAAWAGEVTNSTSPPS